MTKLPGRRDAGLGPKREPTTPSFERRNIMKVIEITADEIERSPSIVHLRVKGLIDLNTSKELERTLIRLLDGDTVRVVLDLRRVDYISSAGWRVIFAGVQRVRTRGGDIKLVRMTPDVRTVYQLLEFERLLEAHDSVKEAVAEFHRGPTGEARDCGIDPEVAIPNPYFASVS
jgi:anti-anti-sigma factor